MNKNFDDFLKTVNDEEILHSCSQYISKSNFNDESEKYLYTTLALSKSLVEKYHQWLNS